MHKYILNVFSGHPTSHFSLRRDWLAIQVCEIYNAKNGMKKLSLGIQNTKKGRPGGLSGINLSPG